MKTFRYIKDVATLRLDAEACVGCGMCLIVCPHGVFSRQGESVRIVDPNGCMECGACALNCPSGAISVTPGVGCAEYIIKTWLDRGKGKIAGCCG